MRPPRRPSARRAAAFLLATALATTACPAPADPDAEAAASADAEADERIATVLELRTTLGPAAADLGSATVTLVEGLESLHAALPAAPDERRTGIDALVTGPVADLERALAGFGPELAGEATGPDAEAVRVALTDARTAGESLLSAAQDDLAIVERLAGADAELAGLVEAWGEAGSRNEQLQRLAEVAGDAEALAAELDAVEDAPGCSGRVARRSEAARAVAEASTELRSLVEARQGEEFDRRRDELLRDPYGSGEDGTLVEQDREEVDCWRDEGSVTADAGEVATALEDLEGALNPADLATADS